MTIVTTNLNEVPELERAQLEQREHLLDLAGAKGGCQFGTECPPAVARETDQVTCQWLSVLVSVEATVDKVIEVLDEALLHELWVPQEETRAVQLEDTHHLLIWKCPDEAENQR